MGKRKARALNVPVIAQMSEPAPASPLKKQNQWSGQPWRPGETPSQSLMGRNVPHDIGATPYNRGVMEVEKPTPRGKLLGKDGGL